MEKLDQSYRNLKQRHFIDQPGWIHGNTVANGWAGAVIYNRLGIQQNLLRTYRSTNRRGKMESRFRN